MMSANALRAGAAVFKAAASLGKAPAALEAKAKEAALQTMRTESYAKVMAHEMAHRSAAGAYASGSPVINYNKDGIAIGGHQNIMMPGINPKDPGSSISAYSTIIGAAMAPHAPSAQDFAVAGKAKAMMGKAQVMMQNKQRMEAAMKEQGKAPSQSQG